MSPISSSACSTATTITPSMAMDIVGASSLSAANSMLKAAAAAGHHMSPSGTPPQKPPTKLYATCFICNKQLSNQYNLRVHLETHQNVRYACTVCSHVSRSKDALRKHVSYRHPGTPSPCDPDTKRKRSKANLGQMIKQEMLNDQNPMSHLIKQEFLNEQSNQLHQQQQQHHTNQLLANLTSQGNSIVSIPTFLQQAASMQSAFAPKSLLFNAASIPTSLASSLTTAQISDVLNQPKDLSHPISLPESANGSPSPTIAECAKANNGSSESMDQDQPTTAEEPSPTAGSAP